MRYPINVKQDGKFWFVAFPDIPEAITQGKNHKEALAAAESALETALDFYFENACPVPAPSRVKKGQAHVALPPSLSAKVLLLNEMLLQKMRPAELARQLQTTPQEVNRLTNLHHTFKIDGIASALRHSPKGRQEAGGL